ncbi:Hypothetical protein CINCED_3A004548 [Cinara cedri]|uniref:Uncharacterized protein n=1 Tax=Cinara cedri TaxID=506608 RepID=A0A5E4NAY2_9HEMI|nr:Hypothetical protein CINCED_3A004548 [Cinara cedri]
MNDDDDITKSKLKGDEPNIDPEAGYSKLFKNKFGSRRSNYKLSTLVILLITVVVISIIGILWYASIIDSKAVNQNPKTCTTESCLKSATLYAESMNRSVDPCEDFYQFACGRYGNRHRIPKTSHSNNRFYEVKTGMLMSISDFMEKEDFDDDPYALSQARLLYRSCTATDEMDAAGIQKMFQFLNQIGLPYLGFTQNNSSSGQTDSSTNISLILANVKKQLNIDYLFSTRVAPYSKNRTLNKITLSKPMDNNMFPVHKILRKINGMNSKKKRELLTPDYDNTENENKENKLNPNLKSYEKYFKGIWQEIVEHHSHISNSYHAPPELKLIKDVLMLINRLKEINDKVYESDLELPTFMTVNELQEYTDEITRNYSGKNGVTIDWKQYFTSLFADVEENIELDFENETIQIMSIEYFDDLFKLLVTIPESQMITAVWWDVVTTLIPYTTNQMRFLQDRYLYDIQGLENNPSRSIYCAEAVNKMMGMAVSRLLMDVELINSYQNMVIEMMKNIHFAFEKIVEELNWMDDETKKITLHKAKNMQMHVGFPEFIKDTVDIDNYYADFEVIENDYFGNVIRYVQNEFNNSLLAFRIPNDYSVFSWSANPLEVNAFNFIQANAIIIPAGILQFPFFGYDLNVLNYGSLGSILGHELTHGFDNSGHKYDLNGNENMWWTKQTIEEYNKRTNCFIEHYESYLVSRIEEKVLPINI